MLMKKYFTLPLLAAVMLLCLAATAGAQTRKSWDFTKGFSELTVYNLTQDASDASSGFWQKNGKGDNVDFSTKGNTTIDHEALTATVDGSAIELPEFTDLKFYITGSGDMLHVCKPAGKEGYIWFNAPDGKKGRHTQIIIPNVPAGEKVTIDYSTHKTGDARGFKSVTDGFSDADGNTTWTSKDRDTVEIINNTGATSDFTIAATNGYHIYSIVIGAGDDPDALKKKVAYIYSGDLTSDPAYSLLSANEAIKVTPLDANTTLMRDDLLKYDVNVLSATIPADNANVQLLKDVQPFEPTLNLNADLYPAWGYGQVVKVESPFGDVAEPSNPLFAGMELVSAADAELAEGHAGVVFGGEAYNGVKLGSYYADDNILATAIGDPTTVAIHSHNSAHNGYTYLPLANSNLASTEGTHAAALVANVINNLAASKADITPTALPTFDVHYGNHTATVKIESDAPYAKIYYTTDGTDPTTKSTAYAEPIKLDAETTVKAIAVGQGYTESAVADTLIRMYNQAAMPTISRVDEPDATTITLSTTDDATIWYAFEATTDTTKAIRYTGPFVLRDHCTLTVFADGDAYVPSEMNTQEIFIKDDRVYADQVSHFDANSVYGGTNGKGMFSWGTGSVSQYDTTKDPIGTTKDADGIEVPVYPEREAEIFPADTTGLDWVLSSKGQSLIWQNTKPGKDVGNAGDYNPATAVDVDTLITKNNIQFYKHNGDEYNASIMSIKKFQGPFNVVSFIGTAGGDFEKMGFETSSDGKNWTIMGDTISQKLTKRLYKKYTLNYSGTDEVYVRLVEYEGPNGSGPQVYDIYIMTEGEKSKAIEADLAEKYATGIHAVKNTKTGSKVVAIYNLNGARLNSLQRGINIVKFADGSACKVLVK